MSKQAVAVVVLSQNSVEVARRLMERLPGALLYGLAQRTTGVDVSFEAFGPTVQDLFNQGTPIVGLCAAGILIRSVAPLLSNKRQEPPVIAVAEDGSTVVPLLGGLMGVNALAREIAAALQTEAAITTTGELRFGVVLEDPPVGYRLANPEQAKRFMADLLAGAQVRLDGVAPWLTQSGLPVVANGEASHGIEVTDYARPFLPRTLVYHPTTLVVGLSGLHRTDLEEAIALVQSVLAESPFAMAAIAAVVASVMEPNSQGLDQIAQELGAPLRLLQPSPPPTMSAAALALKAAGVNSRLVGQYQRGGFGCAIARSDLPLDPELIGQARGQLAVVGIGPGSSEWLSPQARQVLRQATDLVGYGPYLDLLGPLIYGKQRHESDNRQELERATFALDLASQGKRVAVVSSGDPGIFAMAAAVFEVLDHDPRVEWQAVNIQVIPGISAMQAAASRFGAPLGHDFCVVSLSDLLKPWEAIAQRIDAAARADFVLAFYNPVSQQRQHQLREATSILLRWRSPETPVILARNLGRAGESLRVCTLADLNPEAVDMRTLVIIGSSQTRCIAKPGLPWVYTPRHYPMTPPSRTGEEPFPAS